VNIPAFVAMGILRNLGNNIKTKVEAQVTSISTPSNAALATVATWAKVCKRQEGFTEKAPVYTFRHAGRYYSWFVNAEPAFDGTLRGKVRRGFGPEALLDGHIVIHRDGKAEMPASLADYLKRQELP
jgi:hypothetical protein